MIPPEFPEDETARLRSLKALGLLDTPAEERFDRITRLAQTLFDVPIVLVSLVDAERQWFKSRQGLDAAETPRNVSFCGHAILGSDVFEVPDATRDERFRDNPLVTGAPDIRFYAGAPLSAPDGSKIGTLCLIDRRPHELTPQQRQILKDLAALVEKEIASSRQGRALADEIRRGKKAGSASAPSVDATGRKLTVSFGLALAMMLALAFVSYRNAVNFFEASRRVERTHEVILRLEQIVSMAKDEETGARGFVLTGDERYLRPYLSAARLMPGRLSELRRLASDDPAQARRLERVSDLVLRRGERAAATVARRRSGGLEAGIREVRSSSAQGVMESLRSAVDEMQERERVLLIERSRREERDSRRLIQTLAAGAAAGMLIILLALAAIRRDIAARALVEAELVDARDAVVRDAAARRAAQAETERLSERLQAVLDHMDNGVIMVEDGGRMTVFNAAAERIHGAWRNEIEELNRAGTHPPLLADETTPLGPGEDPLSRAMKGETVRDVELYFRTPYRPRGYYLSVSAAPVLTRAGLSAGAVLVVREITAEIRARRRQELQYEVARALAEARAGDDPMPLLLRSLGERMRWAFSSFWIVDDGGRFLRPGARWHAPGLPCGEFSRATDDLMFEPGYGLPGRVWKERRPIWIEDVTTAQNFPRAEAAAASGLRGAFAFPVMAGERCLGVIELLSARVQDSDEDIMRLAASLGSQIGLFRDRRAAAAAAAAAAAQLQAVFDSATDVSIIATDPEGLITVFNRGAERLLGYPAAEMVGRRSPEVLHLAEEVEARCAELTKQLGREVRGFDAFVALAREGGSEAREWTYVRKDGSRFPVHLIVTAVRGAGGSVAGYLGVATDITARKRVEAELARARDLAVDAARAKAQFLANMSHEIRTPMNAIIGMTGLLLDTPLDKRQKDYLKTVRDAGDALLGLINNILDYSKIEAGKMTLEVHDFDLREAVEGAVELVAQLAQQKGLELAVSIPPEISPLLRGDASRLRQVLLNLLGNAVKFTRKGEICVRVSAVPEGGKSLVRVEILDTGIGIPPESVGRLFQSFNQADATTTRRFGGTGLGLAISRQLVELMGGRIGVDSEPGRGSRFWFEVPFERGSGAPAEKAGPSPDLASVRALVVDDSATNREIVRAQLTAWRVDCDGAADAAEGLRLLREGAAAGRPYGLALVDRQMPGADGLSLAAAIKDDRGLSGLPVIMMTSLGDVLSAEEMKDAGLSACLTKPVRQSILFDALVTALSARGADASAAAPAAAPAGPGRRLRVLIVEDNTVNQKVIMLQLQKLGHAPDVVSGGAEALRWLDKVGYDAVLMDCQMPGMDGYEATREIRRRELEQARRRTPVIALTANAMPEDRRKCFEAGMDDYLPKPVKIEDLARVLAARAGATLAANAAADLREMAGDEGFAHIRAEFLRNARRLLDEMRAAADAEDAIALGRAVHSLKGSSGTLGAVGLEAMCRELESRIADGSPPGRWRDLVARMDSEFAAAKRALEAS